MTPVRRLAATIAALAVLLPLLAARADAHVAMSKTKRQPPLVTAEKPAWQWRYRVWMPAVWQRIAWCESGIRPPADPNWRHDSGTYTGAFGFHIGSWQQFRYAGYPARGSLATPWQQYRVALRIHARFGFTGWGCYDLAWVKYGPVQR